MTSSIRVLLDQALDMLEVLETAPLPAEIAQGLKPEDFGGGVNATIGLNYMKGEIEVLTEERDHARIRATETANLLHKEQNEHRSDNYNNQRQYTSLTVENARLIDILGNNGIEWKAE